MRIFKCLVMAALCFSLSTSAQVTPGEKEGQIDKLFAPWNKPDVPGLVVAVVLDGKKALVKGYGSADLENGIPITPITLFHAASLAKQVTAFAVLTLEAQKKLSLDDDVRGRLAEFPDCGFKISLYNLLYHTSGLRDYGGLVQMSGGRMDDVLTSRMILKLISRQKELHFQPGTEFSYCNAGYVALAEVVARASGQSFKDWTRTNIFAPLKMDNTMFKDDPNEPISGAACSYDRTRDRRFERALDNQAAPGPGSLFISAADMANWLAAFQSKTPDEDIWTKLAAPGKLADGRSLNYAAGLIVGVYKGLPILYHSGGWAGYRGETLFFPAERAAIAILTNNSSVDPTQLCRRVADICFDRKLAAPQTTPPAPAAIDAAALDAYVGRYWLTGERVIQITRRENRLFSQMTGDLGWEVFPESADTFAYRLAEAKIQFHRSGPSPAHKLTFWQGAYAMPAERIPAETWSPAVPQEFCGLYYSDELGSTLEVKLGEKGLFIPFIRRDDLLLVPMAVDRFAGKDSSTKLRFVRGSNGKISELRFSMLDARNVKFTRLENIPQ